MLTFFHSPRSRSTRVLGLLHELDALDDVEVKIVTIERLDGSGARDPRNPHPDGKVPLLVEDGQQIWESAAIMQYLADRFPKTGLGIPLDDPRRGAYLSWFAWYAGVLEPLITLGYANLQHPALVRTFRTKTEAEARLRDALTGRDFLLGDTCTAADLLVHSAYAWAGKPGDPLIDAWVDRCVARPSAAFATQFDTQALATA
ncbi:MULTISPECIES: glutathione S-transferase family protein [unclassified Achromobacter]|uniref:glutathione S-transferase family protein n=1 Tax=unclassified Achromobacter TaxID=2626865 RepID=UPI000B51D23F|nr:MULTISPECIES: glutathione S-transferase family protein [unclassified Achromobacter]OWT80992.1 glutathione S-transferase [Achromobacter sp. HZ34]OWT81508.1 glutathione S-transferase [Achromobacter sp. HZ28]